MGTQIWLSVIYTACVVDNIETVKIDHFTKWNGDKFTELESNFTIFGLMSFQSIAEFKKNMDLDESIIRQRQMRIEVDRDLDLLVVRH